MMKKNKANTQGESEQEPFKRFQRKKKREEEGEEEEERMSYKMRRLSNTVNIIWHNTGTQ